MAIETPQSQPRVELLAVLGILGLGFALRVADLAWGLPAIEEEALPMKKAFEMWGWAAGELRLDPETAGWPSLSFYFHLALQHIQYGFGRLSGSYANPLDYFVAYRLDPTQTVLWARSAGVLASLGVIAVALRMGRRLLGPWWGLLPGTLLALSPLFIEHSQMVTPDILLTLFAALAVDRIVAVGEHGRPRDYVLAGVYAGLGTAAKYTPILLCLSLYLVHLRRRRIEGSGLAMGGLEDRRLGWAALATVLAFCAASPYTFADLAVLKRDFAYQMLHMQRGHFGHTAQGPGYLYYLGSVLGPGMGWTALIAGIGGLAVAAWRRRSKWLDLALCVLPLAVVLGALSTRFDRYMLPLLLPLSLGAAIALQMMVEKLSFRAPSAIRPVSALLVLVLLVPTARGAWQHHLQVRVASTQRLAADWLEENVDPAQVTFATEHYGPHVADDERGELQSSPVFARLDADQKQALLDRPFFRYQLLPLYSTRVELGAFFYDLRFFMAHDFVITSGAVRKRYEADPAQFPRQNQFYRDLERYCDLAASFAPGAMARGPEIRIYRVTDKGRRELLRDRGALETGFARDWFQRVHRPHFLGFLEGVAAHALEKSDFAQAALFYSALLEVSPREDRGFVLERVGYSQLRGDDVDAAEISYLALEKDPEYRAVAWANLGFVAERRGHRAKAKDYYQRSLGLGGDAALRQWVQARIGLLER